MNNKVIMLPLDERPITYDFPISVAKISNMEILCPPKSIMSSKRKPVDFNKLKSWLLENVKECNGLVLSTDLLLYGGLIASRFLDIEDEELINRLEIIKEIKEQNTHIPIFAFSSIMRISNNNINDEEKLYWNEYGILLWSYSFYTDKFNKTKLEESYNKAQKYLAQIPQEIVNDWLATRKRNFNINKELINLVEYNIIDTLIFPQDDCAEYGFNISEFDEINTIIENKNLSHRIFSYPGSDETSLSLIAKMLQQIKVPKKDIKIFLEYNNQSGKAYPALYESIPLEQTIVKHLEALNLKPTTYIYDADVVLAIYTSKHQQKDWIALANKQNNSLEKEIAYEQEHLDEDIKWLKKLTKIQQEKPLAIFDLAFANGSSDNIGANILNYIDLQELYAYGGWNTAGNTIGATLGQMLIVFLSKNTNSYNKEQALLCNLERLVEDYIYMVKTRFSLYSQTQHFNSDTDLAINNFKENAQEFLQQFEQNKYRVSDVFFPWNRFFEIGFTIKINNNKKFK